MPTRRVDRRGFLASFMAASPAAALNWSSLPTGPGASAGDNDYDAIIIGSGLGGLSCAAGFARQGFRPLVLEQHYKAGGYATTFSRPGGFVFDVSLHSTSVGERDGVHDIIPGFPEIEGVEFVPHPHLYRAIFPEHDIRVPQRDVPAYKTILAKHFPAEKEGIDGILKDMEVMQAATNGRIPMSRLAKEHPNVMKAFGSTWGAMLDARIKDPKLKAILSNLWGYYGLPPSKLAAVYYAMPTYGYLNDGGYYPVGRSQKISDAFVDFIEDHGGEVILRTRVEKILTKQQAAYAVRTADGQEYTARAIISNASAIDTFQKMVGRQDYLDDYLAKLDGFSISLSCFQVFLGLKKDLVGELGVKDSEIFCQATYDCEADYHAMLNADAEHAGIGVMLYDNLYDSYSPKGKNTLNILMLQGYEPWRKYERDYLRNNKKEYNAEKERIADILIRRVEDMLLPGLSAAIEVKDTASPLTNIRYTSNYEGAIYGWNQTVDNSPPRRLPHDTPVKNLYLSGAWTTPGHGYGGVLSSGVQCFGEIMEEWG